MIFKKNCLMIPHVGTGGGAGIYINDFISESLNYVNVCFTGPYRKDYESFANVDTIDGFSERLYLPCYDGVSKRAKLYWLLKNSIFFFPAFIKNIFLILKIRTFDIIVLTSSIQSPFIVLLRVLGYRGHIICMIQENVVFQGLVGKVSQFLLKRADAVTSISEYWSVYAEGFGISSTTIKNKFHNHRFSQEDIVYDAIFMGGDSRLKGLDMVLEMYKLLSKNSSIKIALLGNYSEESLVRIRRLNAESKLSGSELVMFGLVNDVYKYILASRLVLIPISYAHFCRPAIEAGLCGKTFLIPRLSGLSEFAIDGYNCLMFDHGDVRDFTEKFIAVTDGSVNLGLLENNNSKFAFANYSDLSYRSSVVALYKGFFEREVKSEEA